MDLRNRRGGITPAEGCMFAAVGLFVVLLLAMLAIAFIRFRNPSLPASPPATGVDPQAARDDNALGDHLALTFESHAGVSPDV